MRLPDKFCQHTMSTYFFFVLGVIVAFKAVMEIHVFIGWFQSLFSIVSPFLIGFILAYILNIPASQFQKGLARSRIQFLHRHQRLLGILSVYLLLILLVVFVLRLVIPAVASGYTAFIDNFSIYYENAQNVIGYLNSLALFSTEITMDSIVNALKQYSLENLSGNITASIDALSSVFSTVFTTFLALVSSIYILIEKDRFKQFSCRAFAAVSNTTVYNGVLKYLRALNTFFRQYIYTQTIDGMILGTLATLELLLIIRSPYFLVLGVMLGIVNYIPYFGSIIGSLVAVAVVGFTQGFPMAVLAAVILLVTQQIDGNILQPRLMGNSFSLSPLLIIIAVTAGGSFGGPLGMMAAIPIVAVLKNMLDDLIIYFERRKGSKITVKPEGAE